MTALSTDDRPPCVSAGASMPVAGRPGHVIVALCGDLDIATAPVLREELLGRLEPGGRVLILDLSALSFCDAAGLAILVGTQRRATMLGIAVRLVAPRPLTAKMLRVTGLDRVFAVYRTRSDALIPPAPAFLPSLPLRHYRERVPAPRPVAALPFRGPLSPTDILNGGGVTDGVTGGALR